MSVMLESPTSNVTGYLDYFTPWISNISSSPLVGNICALLESSSNMPHFPSFFSSFRVVVPRPVDLRPSAERRNVDVD